MSEGVVSDIRLLSFFLYEEWRCHSDEAGDVQVSFGGSMLCERRGARCSRVHGSERADGILSIWHTHMFVVVQMKNALGQAVQPPVSAGIN